VHTCIAQEVVDNVRYVHWPFMCPASCSTQNYYYYSNCLFSHTSQKAQLKAPLSPLQTAWTGFNPNLYSGGSSSAGTALVEIATARSFILNRGIVMDTMSATPLEPDGEQCIPLHQGCCQPGHKHLVSMFLPLTFFSKLLLFLLEQYFVASNFSYLIEH